MIKIPKRYRKLFLRLSIIILIISLGYLYKTKIYDQLSYSKVPEKATISNVSNWWDNRYPYRMQISNLKKDENYLIINHAQLVVDNLSNKDASDLVLVKELNEEQTQIDIDVDDVDTAEMIINFKISDEKAKYYLYYGNKFIHSELIHFGNVNLENMNKAENYNPERIDSIIISEKNWIIRKNNETLLTLDLDFINSDYKAYYLIDSSTKPLQIKSEKGKFKIDLSNLEIGEHEIYLVLKSQGKIYRTNTIDFAISHPVYVAFSLNWEGVDPSAGNLIIVDKLSSEYDFPITQFFNPRVLVTGLISELRREEIVSWLKNRIEKGDELAMHVHMHHDMIELAGVRAKDNLEGWNGDYRGFDIPITEYSKDEIRNIIDWGIQRFRGYELPEPSGFRSGGWFANENMLMAVEESGLIYDSSGRKSVPYGIHQVSQKWELTNDMQPYHPSYENINEITSTDNMEIWEIPTNGSDTDNSTKEDMIANFYINYEPGTILDHPVLIVYAGYPESIDSEEEKLRVLFEELRQNSVDYNKGPVVYTTLKQYLEEVK